MTATTTTTYIDADREKEEDVAKYMRMTLPAPPKMRVSELKTMVYTPFSDVIMAAKVKAILQADQDNAYSVARILIEYFGVKEISEHGIQRVPKTDNIKNVYEKVRKALIKLHKEGKVEMRLLGRTSYYWWKKQQEQEQEQQEIEGGHQ